MSGFKAGGVAGLMMFASLAAVGCVTVSEQSQTTRTTDSTVPISSPSLEGKSTTTFTFPPTTSNVTITTTSTTDNPIVTSTPPATTVNGATTAVGGDPAAIAQTEVLTADDLPTSGWFTTPFAKPEYTGERAAARRAYVACLGIEGERFTDFAPTVVHSEKFSNIHETAVEQAIVMSDAATIDPIMAKLSGGDTATMDCLRNTSTELFKVFAASDSWGVESKVESVQIDPAVVPAVGDRSAGFVIRATLSALGVTRTFFTVIEFTQVGDKVSILQVETTSNPMNPTEFDAIVRAAAAKMTG